MWVLDVVADEGGAADTTFYLVAGEWSVGRKRCHFNFQSDASISRTHALIRVGALTDEQLTDPATRPTLELVDQNSRFGSFVNQEQCLETRRLHHGDQISFGAKRTVLRVRYQVFVLVASRIQRANRAQVNDTCQRIGMHLVPAESKDATHCIMDPGRIVATVKVLWALVYNQPVVCTPWIYAILNRSSLAEPLPRCEDFLPSDPAMPAVESNYLPNPLRKSLFSGFVVVFLMPQQMQELIEAMGGIVIAAYKDNEQDDELLRELDGHVPSKHVLLVEPSQNTGFSSTAQQSELRNPNGSETSCPVAAVERRTELFRSMGAVFTSVQELAASVIFVKPPTASNDEAFSSSLASYTGSSVQIMSFPEHLSLRSMSHSAKVLEDEVADPDEKDAVNNEVEENPADITIKADSEQMTDPCYEDEMMRDGAGINITQLPMKADPALEKQDCVAVHLVDKVPTSLNIQELEAALALPVKPVVGSNGGWMSSRDIQARDVKPELDEVGRPLVVSCDLIVKKRVNSGQRSRGDNGLVNYKRFKKGNGVGTRRSTASLFPQQTVISVTVDNPEREVLQENLEAMEEEERIAEELFAMGEGRGGLKLFG
ncbi:hypothetical protein PHYBOEH_009580 [Phytophthora boehmeriae]|uniref:FHA domain-containing protein n=1 Tax=Phytophthora boehmeriae TaxID=109152 RepID=A0A8T1VSX5_9STRA|nr:hypothetical protein PHYBOEH_009580 [Phytophthora boehmeriae]